MKQIIGNKTTSFFTGHDDFIIDIVETTDKFDEPMYETWLYRQDTGTKIFVVGEYKKYYQKKTVTQYARHMIQYLKIVWSSGYNFYDIYDEQIEDVENACMERIMAEVESKKN